MRFFRRNKEVVKEEDLAKDLFLQGSSSDTVIGRNETLKIPSISSGVNLISDIIASLEIKLYKDEGGNIEEVKDDPRTKLLNDETGDILTGFEMKKAIIEDYLLDGNGYVYINKKGNNVASLHYVKASDVYVNEGQDPIFKDNVIVVAGEEYKHYEFITLNRKSKNGSEGVGIIQESNLILSTMYNALEFENSQVKTGGIKKGVIKSMKKLSQEALDKLKESWNKLYGKHSKETCVILNDGLDYKELQQTSVEMQLIENKKLNSQEGYKLLNIPPNLFDGPSDEVKRQFIDGAINPIIINLEAALNKSLILEKEKGKLFFAVNTKDLSKGDIEKRYRAYEIGLKNGFILTNEVRYFEDLPEIADFNYLRMNLGEVLYDVKNKTIFTPNTGQTHKSDNLKGGELNESGNKEQ
ncbi:TPA: phage portal protein [Clostridium perfringens]